MAYDKLLVVGARSGSLGDAVTRVATEQGYTVLTAGISGEQVNCDITGRTDREELLVGRDGWFPDHVVCTVGVNTPTNLDHPLFEAYLEYMMDVNFVAPMALLSEWLHEIKNREYTDKAWTWGIGLRSFVIISSNSAHIARRNSMGYCASKAALSMGVRCVARENADYPINIYAYEPGWMDGTPMSQSVEERFDVGQPLHRIPGERPVDTTELALAIVENLSIGGHYLNGCLLRLDGGEQ